MVAGLLPIIIVAGLILFLCIRVIVQSNDSRAVTIQDFSQAQNMLDSVILERSLTSRIFETDDAAFVSRVATPRVQALFEKERKTLAVKWIRKTQKKLARLMDVHLRLASYTYNPSSRYEFALGAKYLVFLFVSYSALLMVLIEGPYETARMIAYAIDTADRLCNVFRLRLERVNPARLGSSTGRGD